MAEKDLHVVAWARGAIFLRDVRPPCRGAGRTCAPARSPGQTSIPKPRISVDAVTKANLIIRVISFSFSFARDIFAPTPGIIGAARRPGRCTAGQLFVTAQ